MIVVPNHPAEWQALAGFLHQYAGVHPSADMRCIGWVSDEKKLVAVVGFNGFVGKVCYSHVAFAPDWHFAPRTFLHEVFHYVFETAKCDMVLGIVNSKNEKAMRMDLHLGYHEIFRLPGMHEDGGDLIVLAMKKTECRYLDAQPESVAVAETGSA